MPPPSKKRKTAATAIISQAKVPQQRGIQAFGKVSKAQVDRSNIGKSKAIEVQHVAQPDIHVIRTGEKRKRDASSLISPGNDCNGSLEPAPNAQETNSTPSLPQRSNASPFPVDPPSTKPRRKAKSQLNVTATPTKGTRAILESFSLRSSSPSTRSSSPLYSRADTPPTSPPCSRSPSPTVQESKELPDELLDLIDLYASFLTALSLHYAHNGSLAPVDLRVLCPSVARAWRRRAVAVQDIQRILAITQRAQGPEAGDLSLSDYGHGKICIEIADLPLHRGLNRKLIDEETLNARFSQNLEQQWKLCKISDSVKSAEAFVTALPLLPITTCSSLAKLTPMLAKGQRRLEDLKAGAIRAQQSSLTKLYSVKDQSPVRPKLATSRSDSLLSRIRAKETFQSTLPLPPTAAMLERKSSLHRLEEVVPVVALLTSGTVNRAQQHGRPLGNPQLQTQTQSFTMPTLIQYLQMSLRNPISKDDAIRCIRLLAELVPEWVGVREVGKCIGVTVRRGGAVGKEEMDRRVGGMLEKL